MKKMIKVEHLLKRYGQKIAVSDITFSIDQGEVFGLLGPNGAGKSTSINMITGLISKDQGQIIIDGEDLDKNPLKLKHTVGIVPQELAIYQDLTALQNVRFFGELYGLKGKELKESAEEVLEFVGLKEHAKAKAKTFSGGMKRRLNIACGLVHKPSVLILDEPTVGIDPQSRNHILENIRELNKKGLTVIYTTHYMEEAEHLCDRIAIMDKGQIIAQGTLEELRNLLNEHRFVNIRTLEGMPVEAITSIPGVISAEYSDGNWRIETEPKGTQLRDIFDAFAKNNIEPLDVRTEDSNLEDVFLSLTGKSLRD
ncbi:ABC transporter ATP-binding protein [Guggenheimella bovis]